MAFGGSEFASIEYAGEDATADGDLDEFDLVGNVEEFCTNLCGPSPI